MRLPNRANVLLSRCKEGLFIIGNADCLTSSRHPGIWPQVGAQPGRLKAAASALANNLQAGWLMPPLCLGTPRTDLPCCPQAG